MTSLRRGNTQPSRRFGVFSITITVLGGFLALAAYIGFTPLEPIATIFSDDGALSDPFRFQLATSQFIFGTLLLFAGLGGEPFSIRLGNMAEHILDRPSWQITWGSSALSAGLAVMVSQYLLDGLPHVTDEISHLFQSKILLAGSLTAPAPSCPMSFSQPHVIMTAKGLWHSIYPPGHALLIALFSVFGGNAWVGPVSTGVAVAALHRLALRWWRPRAANLSALLLAMSPQVLLLGGSWMSHSSFTALYALAWAAWLSGRTRTTPTARRLHLIATGLLFAWSAIIRPQDFILASAVAACALLLYPSRIPPLLKDLGYVAAGTLPVVIFMAIWNNALYGTPLAIGYGHSQSLTPQMRPTYGFSATFGLAEAARVTGWSLMRLNKSLLGWPASFIFLPALALAPRSLSRREVTCLVGSLLVVAFFFFYFYYGSEYEARFYFTAVPLMIMLTVQGGRLLKRWISTGHLTVLGLVFALHGLFYYWPFDIWPRYHHDYEQVSRIIEDTAARAHIQNAVVLIPAHGTDQFRYSGGFLWNDPGLHRSILYARDVASERDCIQRAFANRTFYRFIPENGWREGRIELITP